MTIDRDAHYSPLELYLEFGIDDRDLVQATDAGELDAVPCTDDEGAAVVYRGADVEAWAEARGLPVAIDPVGRFHRWALAVRHAAGRRLSSRKVAAKIARVRPDVLEEYLAAIEAVDFARLIDPDRSYSPLQVWLRLGIAERRLAAEAAQRPDWPTPEQIESRGIGGRLLIRWIVADRVIHDAGEAAQFARQVEALVRRAAMSRQAAIERVRDAWPAGYRAWAAAERMRQTTRPGRARRKARASSAEPATAIGA